MTRTLRRNTPPTNAARTRLVTSRRLKSRTTFRQTAALRNLPQPSRERCGHGVPGCFEQFQYGRSDELTLAGFIGGINRKPPRKRLLAQNIALDVVRRSGVLESRRLILRERGEAADAHGRCAGWRLGSGHFLRGLRFGWIRWVRCRTTCVCFHRSFFSAHGTRRRRNCTMMGLPPVWRSQYCWSLPPASDC